MFSVPFISLSSGLLASVWTTRGKTNSADRTAAWATPAARGLPGQQRHLGEFGAVARETLGVVKLCRGGASVL